MKCIPIKIICIVIILMASSSSTTQTLAGAVPKLQDTTNGNKLSERDLVNLAIAYLGMDSKDVNLDKVTSSAQSIVDSTTPFVNAKISEKPVMSIVVNEMEMACIDSSVIRDFMLLLNPDDGRLLKISSISDQYGSSDTLPKPPAAEAAKWLRYKDYSYDLFLAQAPQISFMEALAVCPYDPGTAKDIEGLLLRRKLKDGSWYAEWIITLRGTRLLSASSRNDNDIPENLRNKMTLFVNASTGQLTSLQSAP